jgi:hypothetical protein
MHQSDLFLRQLRHLVLHIHNFLATAPEPRARSHLELVRNRRAFRAPNFESPLSIYDAPPGVTASRIRLPAAHKYKSAARSSIQNQLQAPKKLTEVYPFSSLNGTKLDANAPQGASQRDNFLFFST